MDLPGPRPAVSPARHAAVTDFRVLVVCTANMCRSPIAERLFRTTLEQRWGQAAASWRIESAGVMARNNRPIESTAFTVLGERGLDASDFATRRLTAEMAADADLILAATREHRGQIAQLNPSVLGRLFTVNQFAYLLSKAEPVPSTDPVAAGAELIRAAVLGRSQLPGRTVEDDIADPIGQPIEFFRGCADGLQASIDAIVAPLPREPKLD